MKSIPSHLWYELKPVRYSKDQFDSTFKVGDVLAGFSTRKLMQVTAIGRDRFLYQDWPLGLWPRQERVSLKDVQRGWIRLDQNEVRGWR